MESKVYIYGEMLWYKSLVFKKKWNQWIIYKKFNQVLIGQKQVTYMKCLQNLFKQYNILYKNLVGISLSLNFVNM